MILLLVSFTLTMGGNDFETEVTYDGRSLIIDGHRKILFSGSIHYPRSTPQVLLQCLSSNEMNVVFHSVSLSCNSFIFFYYVYEAKILDLLLKKF